MSARAAFVLGASIIAAALLHGGVWTAGRDFVVNRFTGEFHFVPGDGGDDEDAHWPTHAALTTSEPDARYRASTRRR